MRLFLDVISPLNRSGGRLRPTDIVVVDIVILSALDDVKVVHGEEIDQALPALQGIIVLIIIVGEIREIVDETTV